MIKMIFLTGTWKFCFPEFPISRRSRDILIKFMSQNLEYIKNFWKLYDIIVGKKPLMQCSTEYCRARWRALLRLKNESMEGSRQKD